MLLIESKLEKDTILVKVPVALRDTWMVHAKAYYALKQMNIEITLPDGTIKEYNSPVTGFQVAQDIGSRLAKDAVCVEINKELFDTSFVIDNSTSIKIITTKELGVLIIKNKNAVALRLNKSLGYIYEKNLNSDLQYLTLDKDNYLEASV